MNNVNNCNTDYTVGSIDLAFVPETLALVRPDGVDAFRTVLAPLEARVVHIFCYKDKTVKQINPQVKE